MIKKAEGEAISQKAEKAMKKAVRGVIKDRKTPYDILLSQVRNTLIEGQECIEEEKVRTYW